MKKIAIISDTDCSLPIDLVVKYGIRQVPINLIIDGETYETGVDINDHLLFEKIGKFKEYPTTSAPSPLAFDKAYKAAILEGYQTIICICVSSKVSGTYDSAVLASRMFQHDIAVIDSQNLSMGQGFMVLAAAECVFNGGSKEEVLEHITNVENRVHTFAILPCLKYIALSGRLKKYSAGIADLLDIKPILTVQDGKLEVVSQQRTTNKAIIKTIELVHNICDGKSIEQVAIIHSDNLEKAQYLFEKASSLPLPKEPYILSEFTPGLSVHTGPGAIGITVLTNK